MGELRKRGNIWWVRYYRNGRRHEESSRSTKKGDGERLLRIREGDIAKGLPVTAKTGQLRFDEAAADVVSDYRVNGKKTLGQLERRIRLHLEPFFGGRRMASITSADARAYRRSPTSRRRHECHHQQGARDPKACLPARHASREAVARSPRPMLRESNVRQGFFQRDQFEAVRGALPPELRAW